jgi:hypothetical protein
MVALWSRCGFADVGDVVNQSYDACPHEEPDPFMTDDVQTIINAAEAGSTSHLESDGGQPRRYGAPRRNAVGEYEVKG